MQVTKQRAARSKPFGSKSNPISFDDINPEASLWILLPKTAAAILLSEVLWLAAFYLQFGAINAFALGFGVFLAALQVLIIVGLRFQNRTEVHAQKKARGDWLDKLGAWWLIACAFGALLGWLVGKLPAVFPGDENFYQLAKVLLTIVLPLVTMLPNLRYLSPNAAHIQVPLLIGVTLLPILVGIGSLLRLWNYFIN